MSERLPNKLSIIRQIRSSGARLKPPIITGIPRFEGFNKNGKRAFPDILIGILSYNRWRSLDRLLKSLNKPYHRPVNIIVSDDHSHDNETLQYLSMANVCKLKNNIRLGVAGNSNRILKAARRFKHLFILNDDVVVDDMSFIDEFIGYGLPHMCGHTPGIYGSKYLSGLSYMQEKMQGSILYIDTSIINTVGYFDERFGYYGMEHVDWSKRAAKRCVIGGIPVIQSAAIHTHPEDSVVENRKSLLSQSKGLIAKTDHTIYVGSDVSVSSLSVSVSEPYHQMVLAMDHPEIIITDGQGVAPDITLERCCPMDDGFLRNGTKNTGLFAPLYDMNISGGFASGTGIPRISKVMTFGDGRDTAHTDVHFIR